MTSASVPATAVARPVSRGWDRWRRQHGGPLIDVASAVLLVVGAGVIVLTADPADPAGPASPTWATWLRVGLTLGLALGMVWRRRHPLALTVVAVGAVALGASELVLPVMLGTLAVRRHGRLVVGAAVAAAAAYLFARGYYSPPSDRAVALLAGVPNALVLAGLPVAVGAYLRTRGDLLRELRERAHRAETEEAARIEQARLAERTRIAREMHDVLAHRISLVALHAGALELSPGGRGDEVQQSAGQIRAMAREALDDLRGVLGVLRSASPDPEPSLRPQPTLRDLDQLVAASAQAGIEVHVDDAVAAGDDPPQLIGRTAYRLVQESLTNVHRHAPGARADVRVAGTPGVGLQVEVANDAPSARQRPSAGGAGLGLVGLRERVELAGGSFSAASRADGGFLVRADLPWPTPQAVP